ncbi:acetyl-CoA carboxylase [Burkholderia stagnalis]|uniref:Acetyl-CoA carboxylase n=1 Tax=Burkholderia stagnalis TaxID=1503054 RepID=A0ABX9YW25_9BURK|nr:acetyl-CoA carboxylase [Burkholderia stagnalis]RQQ64390.1 acetyl-CoA carboxylase [Burkholderia stagnalis]RQR03782.1 acetyl-CoA carboxylase [Burkholderia stagnalis]RQR12577.1 acetyl-CoA carboxylase [Burkholderia stagnalis]RQR15269.1 acetyl-CoA carboxylase [Burkholderia stagnalis]RQY96460.1 acetyl-CoA carboxylase [Burkholderia stagnalis]
MHNKITPWPWQQHALYPEILVSSHAPTLSLLTVDAAGAAHFINPHDCQLASASAEIADALAQVLGAIPPDVLKSSVRVVAESALLKAGFLTIPPKSEPPRHIRICGENL